MFKNLFNFNKQNKKDEKLEEIEKVAQDIMDKEIKKSLVEALDRSKQLEVSIVGNPLLASSYQVIKNTNEKLEESINNIGKPYNGPPISEEEINKNDLEIKNKMREIISNKVDLQESMKEINKNGNLDTAINTITSTIKTAIETNDKYIIKN